MDRRYSGMAWNWHWKDFQLHTERQSDRCWLRRKVQIYESICVLYEWFVDTSLSQNALLTTSSLFEMQCAATIEVVEWSTSGVGLYWGCQKWLPYCHILVHMHGWTREVCNHVIALLNKVTYAFKKDYVSPATKFASWRMHCCLAEHCSRTIPFQRWECAARG